MNPDCKNITQLALTKNKLNSLAQAPYAAVTRLT